MDETKIPSLENLVDLYFTGTMEQVLAKVSTRYLNDYKLGVVDRNKPKVYTDLLG
ncbi:hypothetical protein ACXZ1K_06440 [Pedobacter sp. PWIIR3]